MGRGRPQHRQNRHREHQAPRSQCSGAHEAHRVEGCVRSGAGPTIATHGIEQPTDSLLSAQAPDPPGPLPAPAGAAGRVGQGRGDRAVIPFRPNRDLGRCGTSTPSTTRGSGDSGLLASAALVCGAKRRAFGFPTPAAVRGATRRSVARRRGRSPRCPTASGHAAGYLAADGQDWPHVGRRRDRSPI